MLSNFWNLTWHMSKSLKKSTWNIKCSQNYTKLNSTPTLSISQVQSWRSQSHVWRKLASLNILRAYLWKTYCCYGMLSRKTLIYKQHMHFNLKNIYGNLVSLIKEIYYVSKLQCTFVLMCSFDSAKVRFSMLSSVIFIYFF